MIVLYAGQFSFRKSMIKLSTNRNVSSETNDCFGFETTYHLVLVSHETNVVIWVTALTTVYRYSLN